MCMCVCVRVRACMHACIHVCMYVCMYVYMYVCMYVCMLYYVCMYYVPRWYKVTHFKSFCNRKLSVCTVASTYHPVVLLTVAPQTDVAFTAVECTSLCCWLNRIDFISGDVFIVKFTGYRKEMIRPIILQSCSGGTVRIKKNTCWYICM